jgi:hypothetical protein
VLPQTIRRLYELDARGIRDADLIDEVAWALYARCESILRATNAGRGRVHCPWCDGMVPHRGRKEVVMRCACGWESTWGDYLATYQHRQLSGGGAVGYLREYMAALPSASTPAARMLLIDRLIHECHLSLRDTAAEDCYTRPVAVNLIEGNMTQVMVLLEELAYGPGSTPGARERLDEWRRRVWSVQ